MARPMPWLWGLLRGLLWTVAAVLCAVAFDLPLPPLLGGAVLGGVASGVLDTRARRPPMSPWLAGLRNGLLWAAGALLAGSLYDISIPQLLAAAVGGGAVFAVSIAWAHRSGGNPSPERGPDAVPAAPGRVGG